MGNIYAKPAVEFAIAQEGKVCGKGYNEYAKKMDEIEFYNYPKNGSTDSCSIFVDRCVLEGAGGDKYDALYAVCEPQGKGSNEGAGCTQSAAYFAAKGLLKYSTKDIERGDKIFFKKSNAKPGVYYHTGICTNWNEKGYYVTQGNTNGGIVATKFYTYDDPVFGAVGKVRYDGWEAPTSKPSNKAEPTKPETTTNKITTTSKELRVDTQSSPLTMRVAPNTRAASVGSIPKGTTVKELAVTNGEFVHGDNTWIRVNYNGVTAWVSGYYLTRI